MHHINVKAAIKLISNKSTTIAEMCKFLFADVQTFQQEREDHYLQNLKQEFQDSPTSLTEEILFKHAEWVTKKIEQDTKVFGLKYAEDSIDAVLDAINNKEIRSKKQAHELIELLMTFKHVYLKDS